MTFKFKLLAALLPAVAAGGIQPSHESARERGPQIFNAVHDSMRQWGSSLHHNGMSVFFATVPEGTLLYHGNDKQESPTEPDWLAYEIEHAEQFARTFRPPPGNRTGPPEHGHGEDPFPYESDVHQQLLGREEPQPMSGWLHVYRATRPLRLLYVDGMSGGKSSIGTLDSQDLLLRGKRTIEHDRRPPPVHARGGGPMGERERAFELCDLSREYDLDGMIRMEAGFEIIKCDFSDGMEEVQALPRRGSTAPAPGPPGHHNRITSFEYVRGVAERYHGIGASRTVVDYSSMVSAFFFPVDITNPDGKRPDLPRLSNVSDEELDGIRAYVSKTLKERRQVATGVDWQGVSDLIVGRYADRLEFMTTKVNSTNVMADEAVFLLDLFIDYTERDHLQRAIPRCTEFYLQTISPATEIDHLILTAFRAVTSRICTDLFRVRGLVADRPPADDQSLAVSKEILTSLIEGLGWSRFLRCPACGIDEVCFVPMWPMGNKEDYRNPRCVRATRSDPKGESYWGPE